MANFENPTGNWSHQGRFSVQLSRNTDLGKIQGLFVVRGNTLEILNGKVHLTESGFDLIVDDFSVHFVFHEVIRIRDELDEPLWVNPCLGS